MLYVVFDTNNSYITQLHADSDEQARTVVTGMLRRNQPVGFVQKFGPSTAGQDKPWIDVTAAVVDADEAYLARRGGEW